MPKHKDFEKVFAQFVSKYGKEKGKKIYYSWINKHKYDDTKSVDSQSNKKELKRCVVEGLQIKEKGEDFYSSGYIATTHPDRAKDIFSKSVLDKWESQINNPSGENCDAYAVSIHHDRDDIDLAGVAVSAEVKPMDEGNYGLWVETKHNKEHPGYDKLKYETANKMIYGYSVEFKTLDDHPVMIGEEEYRMIDDANLRGYGFAGPRGIVNPEAKIVDYATKELVSFNEKELKEDNKMKVKEDEETKKQEDEVSDVPKKEEEKPKEEETENEETPKEEEEKSEEEEKEFKEWKKMKKNNEFKEKVKSVFEELQTKEAPRITPGKQIEEKEKIEVKEVTDYKESLKTKDPNLMFKEAGKLVSKFPSIAARSGAKGILRSAGVDYKEMEYKALTKTTNEASQYYQAVAELNDVYDPVINVLLNDRTTTLGIIPVDDYSGRQMIQFRSVTSGITALGYTEGSLDTTAYNVTRKKFEQDFANYEAVVEVTGQMIASNERQGGIGNIFSKEVQRAAIDLRKKINSDFLTGSAATYDGSSDQYLLGAQHIINDTGTIYGRSRSGKTYIQGTDEAMSSASLSFGQLRKMIRTVIKNGASRDDLVFVTSYALLDIYRSICQGMMYVVPESKRVGFEGVPSFDGVPIVADAQADDDDVFLMNIGPNGVRRGVQLAPTLTEFGITGDSRKAFIKTYFNFYCKDMRLNYWSSGFATS